ncbi:putative 3-hydroxyphenylpropionic transporter MhpT [Serratia liquefaciens]|nr:putative 3-hydroxyphenylpropionic transporter MhpT [Serratia liquefaciens]
MYCGVPIGAALAAALGFSGLAAAWQIIFWIGGVVPLLLIPLLMRWLPESQAFQRAEASVPLRTLFAPGQAAATLLLWLGYFFTLLVVYMLIQLAADAAGGPGIPRQPGGRGDVLSADRRRLRHAAAGGANG